MNIEKIKRIAVLSVILIAGFFARAYHWNFPSIGYHNMKENEYLSMAHEMQKSNDYLTRKIYFYNAFAANSEMKMYPQPPIVSYQTIFAWKVLGKNLWGARLINIMFGLGSILVVYFCGLILFANVRGAMLSALFLALMPLAVFFSRNIQPESPGLFFMLLGSFFYLKFAFALRARSLLWGGVFFSIAWLYKFTFLLGAVPFLCCFPFKKICKSRSMLFKNAAAFIAPFILIVAAIVWIKSLGQWQFQSVNTLSRIKIFEIFTPAYWHAYGRSIWWYTWGENFAQIYVLLACVGVFAGFVKKAKTLLERFLIGWTLTVVPYCMLLSDFINQHSYYQMPFLGLVCFASAYTVLLISRRVKRDFGKEVFVYIASAVIGLSLPFAWESFSRMHMTVFLGEDVAGETIKSLTKPDERVFLYTFSQGYGISQYAQRYMGWPKNLEEFKRNESDFKVRYVCFYPAEFAYRLRKEQPEMFEYIRAHYRVKEAGLTDEPNKLFYVIMEKGEDGATEDFLQSFKGDMQLRTIYNIFDRYFFFYTIRPPKETAT